MSNEDHLNDYEKVNELICLAGGVITGRTRLQKIAYLLEISGLGSGYSFKYHNYGPFCEELADSAKVANILGVITEEEKETSWGGFYSIYSSSTAAKSPVNKAAEKIAHLGADANSVVLELAATAAYLSLDGSKKPWEKTKELKPSKATQERIAEAKSLYSELSKIDLPEPLPELG
ncbi:MAG: hypothetical protein COA47_15645 [Robiginitomaculum sp.]|nr:MAG: hypothetical protein COA47_15645 [Robiginitomaculum sp.]